MHAHRVSYALAGKSIPKGLLLRHTCDVRHCVNPSHLVPGTHQDNSDDKLRRGRHTNKGETHGMTHLTWENVRGIRKRYAVGFTQQAIANMYGIHQSTVSLIVHNKNWKE